MEQMLAQIIGWFGTSIYIGSHGYFTLSKNPSLKIYFTAIIFAASCVGLSAFLLESEQMAAIQALLALMAVLSLKERVFPKIELISKLLRYAAIAGLALVFRDILKGEPGQITNFLSWTAVFILANGFILMGAGKITRLSYFAISILFAGMVAPQLIIDDNYPAIGIQIFFAVFSAIGIHQILKRKNRQLPLS